MIILAVGKIDFCAVDKLKQFDCPCVRVEIRDLPVVNAPLAWWTCTEYIQASKFEEISTVAADIRRDFLPSFTNAQKRRKKRAL